MAAGGRAATEAKIKGRDRRAVSRFLPSRCTILRGLPKPRPAPLPCRSCRRLRSFDLKNKNQKIAAFGSSYTQASRRC
ncbi:hypothetical protein EGJ53_15355 [Pseudomonas fluorescens]|nr:hypothetical protein EGJ53_15355 [Pseudomonas fluorescens]